MPYAYKTVMACPFNRLGEDEASCVGAFTDCERLPRTHGPKVRVYRQLVLPGQRPQDNMWGASVGTTCYPDLVPNDVSGPQLTMTMIKDAWAHTPFAKPGLGVQPFNRRALVTKPEYYRVVWPQADYQPGEVRTVTLLGHQVRIKPTLVSYNYDFGDGTSSGPTTSAGGLWPTGDITHPYDDAGTYPARVAASYGGQFSVDGSDWLDLPGQTTITGPSVTITVVTLKTRLVIE